MRKILVILVMATSLMVGAVILLPGNNDVEAQTTIDALPENGVIKSGGTYSGTRTEDNPANNAVTINTTQPVTIDRCTLTSKGDLIEAIVDNANVTVKNCTLKGLHPGVSGTHHGFAFLANTGTNIGKLVFEHNTVISNQGVLVRAWNHGTSGETFKVRYNDFKQIEGRTTTSSTGYHNTDYSRRSRAVGVANVHDVPGFEISWNKITNVPPGAVGDVLSMYGSGGNAANPYHIANNLIDGAFGPAGQYYYYDGGGIITDGGTTDPNVIDQYLRIHDNTVLDSLNYGVKISQGNHNELYNNVVVRDGKFSNGTVYLSPTVSNASTGSGVGFQNAQNQPDSLYNNNHVYDNKVSWYDPRTRRGQRNFNTSNCSTCSFTKNNAPYAHPLTDIEDAARKDYFARATAAGVVFGPRS